MAKHKYDPIVDLLVACEMAGTALVKVAGSLQEQFNRGEQASGICLETIDSVSNEPAEVSRGI